MSHGKKLLACNQVEETQIRNHSCVLGMFYNLLRLSSLLYLLFIFYPFIKPWSILAPVVTQGPYYHMLGHPIRQNMAENELGLLFVSLYY